MGEKQNKQGYNIIRRDIYRQTTIDTVKCETSFCLHSMFRLICLDKYYMRLAEYASALAA